MISYVIIHDSGQYKLPYTHTHLIHTHVRMHAPTVLRGGDEHEMKVIFPDNPNASDPTHTLSVLTV